MTEEQAKALYASGFWKDMDMEARFRFQINEPRLCMPFGVFHEATEKTLDRAVWTHEFVNLASLWREYAGERLRPTMQQIIDMIPASKRIIVMTNP